MAKIKEILTKLNPCLVKYMYYISLMFNAMDNNTLILISKFIIPFLLGSLFFFSAVIAPTIFSTLDQKNSSKIIRRLFPKLYTWSTIFSLLILLLVLGSAKLLIFLSFVIFLGYIYSSKSLMHKINSISDSKFKNKNKLFKKYHSLSVIIFVTQIIFLFFIYFSL